MDINNIFDITCNIKDNKVVKKIVLPSSPVIPNVDQVMCNTNNSIMPEERNSDNFNEENDNVSFSDYNGSEINGDQK